MTVPRLLAILDLEVARARELDPAALLDAWLQYGVRDVLVRTTARDGRRLLHVTRLAVAHAQPVGGRVLVSDRVDIALIARADGVQLASDGIDLADVAELVDQLGRHMLLARSVHTLADPVGEPRHAWITAAPVFAPTSKPSRAAPLGVNGLRALIATSAVPVLALGGITPERVAPVAAVGAHGVAVLGTLATLDRAAITDLVEAATDAWPDRSLSK